MEVRIKDNNGYVDADWIIKDGIMVVSPKGVKYMYKVGEVIFVRSMYKHICIYKESANGYLYSSVDLVDDLFDIDDTTVCNECDITEIRPATEEEKKKLFDKLAEEGYEWDAEKKELVKLKWKPKFDTTYYKPLLNVSQFRVDSVRWYNLKEDEELYQKGWVFQTNEDCAVFVKKLNQAIEGVKP